MLIRNYRNLTELENKRRKQLELLNIAIDNERINEERISNYQNPNKPPPVPPQYKTGAEITNDLVLQERTGIQNLESIGIDLPTATNVVNNLRLSNIDYLVKLNRNFPFIKRNITEKFNVKLLNAVTILAYLDSVFNDIDENFGLSSKGQESLVAKTGREFVAIIPTNEQISELYDTLQDINTTIGGYVFDKTGYTTLLNYLDLLEKTLPTETELKSIDLLPVNERNSILRKLSSLVSTFRVPSGGTIKQLHSKLVEEINDAVAEEQAGGTPDYEVIEKTIDLISRNIGGIGEEGFRKINEVKNSIKKSNEVSGFKGRIVEQEADLPEKEYLVEELASKEKNSIKAGPFGSSLKKEFYVKKGYKIYGQEQVIKDDMSFGNYYIDEKKYKELENCKVKTGDILISLVGTYGKISVIPHVFEEGIINPRLMKITPDEKIIRPDFLKILLQGSASIIQMKNQSRGGTMDIVNVGIMRKIKLPVPPIALQTQFSERVAIIEQQKAIAHASLEKSEQLFNSLLQKAFKGELV